MIYFILGFITGATIGTFFMHQAKVYENKISKYEEMLVEAEIKLKEIK